MGAREVGGRPDYVEEFVVPRMAIKKWATARYYSGVVLVVVGSAMSLLGRHRSSAVLSSIGVVFYVCFAIAAVVGIAISRCPYCRRWLDMRGPSAHWPEVRKADPVRLVRFA